MRVVYLVHVSDAPDMIPDERLNEYAALYVRDPYQMPQHERLWTHEVSVEDVCIPRWEGYLKRSLEDGDYFEVVPEEK